MPRNVALCEGQERGGRRVAVGRLVLGGQVFLIGQNRARLTRTTSTGIGLASVLYPLGQLAEDCLEPSRSHHARGDGLAGRHIDVLPGTSTLCVRDTVVGERLGSGHCGGRQVLREAGLAVTEPRPGRVTRGTVFSVYGGVHV